jgi:hypothetical protein
MCIEKEVDISEIFGEGTLNKKYFESILDPKIKVSKAIKDRIEERNTSLRKLSDKINKWI